MNNECMNLNPTHPNDMTENQNGYKLTPMSVSKNKALGQNDHQTQVKQANHNDQLVHVQEMVF